MDPGPGPDPTDPVPTEPQIPRTLDTDYVAAAAMRSTFEAINYDLNMGQAGRGVKIAVLDTGIRTDHPALAQRAVSVPRPLPSDLVNPAGSDAEGRLDHGTIVSAMAGGRIDKTAYGPAYEAALEYVCCLESTDRDYNEAVRHLGEDSDAFVVNHSYNSVISQRLRINDVAQCRLIVQPPTACVPGAEIEIQAPVHFAGTLDPVTELNPLHKACVDPDSADERMCVFAAGNDGFHFDGQVEHPNRNYRMQMGDLLDAGYTFLSEPDRAALASRLYRRGSYPNLPGERPQFLGHHISVAALDARDVITPYSNGCGEAMNYCLSAPGNIPLVLCDTSADGFCGGTTSGTSLSAPLVAGAAALLKSTYPNLSAPDVVTILLTTATDLGDDGPDNVYGMGKLDVMESLRPQGDEMSSAGETLADTAIAAGPVLDAALARSGATFGMFDMHGRPYLHKVAGRTNGRGAEAVSGMLLAESERMELGLERRMGLAGAESGMLPWTARAVRFASGIDICRSGCSSGSGTRPPSLVPSSSVAWHEHHLRTDSGSIGFAIDAGHDGDSKMSYASGKLFLANALGPALLRIEAGVVDETETFMGGGFGGALAVGAGRSGVLSARLGMPLGDKALSAGYSLGKTRSGGAQGSYVTEVSDVVYDGYRLAYGGEDWELHYTVPLAATGGGMRIESVAGYSGESGDWSTVETGAGVEVIGESSARDWEYRTDSDWIDFGAGARERRLGFTVSRPLGAWEATLAVEHVANSPWESHTGDEIRVAAGVRLGLD